MSDWRRRDEVNRLAFADTPCCGPDEGANPAGVGDRVATWVYGSIAMPVENVVQDIGYSALGGAVRRGGTYGYSP